MERNTFANITVATIHLSKFRTTFSYGMHTSGYGPAFTPAHTGANTAASGLHALPGPPGGHFAESRPLPIFAQTFATTPEDAGDAYHCEGTPEEPGGRSGAGWTLGAGLGAEFGNWADVRTVSRQIQERGTSALHQDRSPIGVRGRPRPDRSRGTRHKKTPLTAFCEVRGVFGVEPRGVEPLTSAMQRQRSTN